MDTLPGLSFVISIDKPLVNWLRKGYIWVTHSPLKSRILILSLCFGG